MSSKAYFAGGCFWCTEAVFIRVNGVEKVLPGYIGGNIKNPTYKEVCSGLSGHAEGVEVVFDSKIVSHETLVLIFFTSHDPTTINRQGNDVGIQYRSAIFYESEKEKQTINSVVKRLIKESVFENPIATEILPKTPFYKAEQEHQSFFEMNNQHPYCQAIISPKINKVIKKYKKLIKRI